MHVHDQDNPWMFHRDELDLFEDELEALYTQFHHEDGNATAFESVILHEQAQTEERSDHELSKRLASSVLEELMGDTAFIHQHAPSSESLSDRESDTRSVRAHPLYQHARMWMEIVKPCAKESYEQGGALAVEWFRVYANVNMVPLKVSTALCEASQEDRVGFEVACEEFHLALVYLQRILESLSRMTLDLEQGGIIHLLHAQTLKLQTLIAQQLTQLQQRPSPRL